MIVEAVPREDRGKNAARRLRREGHIPAVLYGGQKEAVALAVNANQVAGILRSETGRNTIFTLRLDGREERVLLKDWQVDPVRGSLLHVDLLRVAMDVRMRVKVRIHTLGEPEGVKLQGGVFEIVTREVEVECLPGDIPEEFKVDVSGLTIGKQLRAGDLPLEPGKVRLVTDPQRVLAHVVALKKEEEVVAPEAIAAPEVAPAEPEVIKKGRKEGEEAEEAAEAEPKKEREKEKEK
jgi:large subunit ribosomal protein L25